jgi:hypothetical protein
VRHGSAEGPCSGELVRACEEDILTGFCVERKIKEVARKVKEVKDVDVWVTPPARTSLTSLIFSLTVDDL